MKRTFSRLRFVCAITFLCVSAGANAVIYQAESFNNANDTTAGNSGGACTNNVNVNVDIQGTTDAGGGCNVGWIAQGEWLALTASMSRRPAATPYGFVWRARAARRLRWT